MKYNRRINKFNKYRSIKKIAIIIVTVIVLVLGTMLFCKYLTSGTMAVNSPNSKTEFEQNNSNSNTTIVDNSGIEKNENRENSDNIVKIEEDPELEKPEIEEPEEFQNVGIDYFKDAVFIGDSRTEGFIINNGLSSKTTSYTHKGLTVDSIFTNCVINMNGRKLTILEALEKTSFSKVYVMLGINETGWVYSSLFIKKYGELIDQIRKINPNCIIYVQSILPVSDKVSEEHSYINNSKIEEYNSLIKKMAKEKDIYYLNVKENVANLEGALPEEAATDGIHLNRKYCEKWLEYLKNHTIEENENE